MTSRFALQEDGAFRSWLSQTPRAVVLLRGLGCAYSATFEKAFLEEALPAGWVAAIRQVEEGGEGPVGDALGVEVTPTVVAFTRGDEAARLPGKLLLGITRQQYRRWVRRLG